MREPEKAFLEHVRFLEHPGTNGSCMIPLCVLCVLRPTSPKDYKFSQSRRQSRTALVTVTSTSVQKQGGKLYFLIGQSFSSASVSTSMFR